MSKSLIEESLVLLGLRMIDRVTGFEGVVCSISFDLYGCVMATLNPPLKDGKLGEQAWFDVKRLITFGEHPRVMEPPDFGQKNFGDERGGENKPLMHSA